MTQQESGAITGRKSLLVAGAFFTASLLGFALLAIIARWLTPDQNAQFLAVWGLVFGFGAALSAVEQEIVRLATRARLTGDKVPARAVQVTALAGGAALSVLAILAFVPGVGQIVRLSAAVTLLTFIATGGFAMLCLSRGALLGSGQIRRYALVVVAEALGRVLLAAACYFGHVQASIGLATAAIAIGCFGWVPWLGSVARVIDWRGPREPMGAIVKVVGALGLGNGLAAIMLTTFPTLVTTVIGSAAGLGTLFGAVTLARVPLVALTPIQALAVPIATRLVVEGKHDQLRRLVVKIGAVAWGAGAITALVAWFIGPWALQVYLGDQYQASPAMMAVLLASSCVIAAALLQVAALVSMQRYRDVVASWLLADAMAVVVLFVGRADPQTAGVAAFALGSILAWALSATLVMRAARRAA